MKLSLAQIKAISTGADRVQEKNGRIWLNRFTEAQQEPFLSREPLYCNGSFCTAGIRFWFRTDSKRLFLKVMTGKDSNRTYFSFDVYANAELVGYLDNMTGVEMPEFYKTVQLPLGEFSKEFDLGEGVKTVCVYFPWSTNALIEEVSLDDGAMIEPVKPEKKLVVFGDSISQGYDAQRPSGHYASRLADALGAELFNKAIGGDKFFSPLAEQPDEFEPDYITVAYGTNDWSTRDKETVLTTCRAFYEALCRHYPNTRIFGITPIWRKDRDKDSKYGLFDEVDGDIRETVRDLKNVTIISGYDFVPKDETYFADARLHPNDRGFDHYFENLWPAIQAELT